ncbi:hypothetical protein X925_04560 [Petrotoga sp. 9T1HF07.CasAA.8.2]|nr:hypothetical protein X925_04560 [Petrotoga sp. 9T1HF07.CasAA.8.2]
MRIEIICRQEVTLQGRRLNRKEEENNDKIKLYEQRRPSLWMCDWLLW